MKVVSDEGESEFVTNAIRTLDELKKVRAILKQKLRQEKMFKQLYSMMELPHQLRDYQTAAYHNWRNGIVAFSSRGNVLAGSEAIRLAASLRSDGGYMNGAEYEKYYGAPISVGLPRRGVMVLPTATGKTLIGQQAMKETGLKTLVIVPTEALLYQWAVKLMNTGLEVGQYWGKGRIDGDVIIGIYNSVSENVKDVFENYKIGMVIADEVHHIAAETFSKVLLAVREGYWEKPLVGKGGSYLRDLGGRVMTEKENINFDYMGEEEVTITGTIAGEGTAVEKKETVKLKGKDRVALMGLTASPYRADGGHLLIFQLMPVVYRMTLKEAMAKNILAPLETERVSVELSRVEWEEYNEYTATIRRAFARFGVGGHLTFKMLLTIDDPLARAAVKAISKRKVLLANAEDKLATTVEIIRTNNEKKTLTFSESIKAVNEIKLRLNALGIPAETYHSEMPASERIDRLWEWETGEFNHLLSVKALEEGLDVPEVSVGIVTASTQRHKQFIQRLGRILRPFPGKTATLYILYANGTLETRYLEILDNILSGYLEGGI